MKTIVLVIAALWISVAQLSAQMIQGKITDTQTGLPLPGATIMPLRGSEGAAADSNGAFQLQVPAGRVVLEVRHLGYRTSRKELNLKEGETYSGEFPLDPESYFQEQVVVTANKTGMNRDNATVNITVIDQEHIEKSPASNILPVLSQHIPGLFVTERGITGFGLAGGSAGKISIRGVGGSDASFPVLLLIDGQPQFMGMMGHPIPDAYVSSDIEKVEVVKGPASLLYGTNAMGGAINLITRRQKSDGLSIRGRIMYGSFDTQKYTASAGFRKNRFDVLASFNHDQTSGARPNSDFNINNGYIKLGYAISDQFHLNVNAQHTLFKAYDPGSVYHPNPAIYDNKSQWVDIARSNLYFTLSNKFEKSEGGLKAYHMSGDHSIYDGWKSNDENMGMSLYQGYKLSDVTLVSAGIDLKRYGGRGVAASLGARSGEWISVEEHAIYTMLQHIIAGSLTLNAGIRYDGHTLFPGKWVPQLGAAYKLTSSSILKASVAQGFRNPAIRELYLFPTANSEVVPETMWNYEVTFEQKIEGNRGNAELTLFQSEGENMILAVPNPNAPPPFKNQNSGAFSHYGLETAIRYHISPSWQIAAGYSYLHMDTPRIASPEHQLTVNTQYQLGQLSLSGNLQYIGDLYTRVQAGTESVKNSFLLIGARAAYAVTKNLDLSLSAENLLGQEYQLQYGYPMPGRTWFAGLSIRF